MTDLSGKRIAILATDGFEQSELTSPLEALRNAKAQVDIVSLKSGKIRGWQKDHWGEEIEVDRVVSECSADDYDGLVLPGGVISPDKIRVNEAAVNFVQGFFSPNKQKPVAAICHGPWTLINAKVVSGKKLTSFPSIKMDLLNAGAAWVDEEVVVDQGLVTSRSPSDLEAFNRKMLEEFGEGTHRVHSDIKSAS